MSFVSEPGPLEVWAACPDVDAPTSKTAYRVDCNRAFVPEGSRLDITAAGLRQHGLRPPPAYTERGLVVQPHVHYKSYAKRGVGPGKGMKWEAADYNPPRPTEFADLPAYVLDEIFDKLSCHDRAAACDASKAEGEEAGRCDWEAMCVERGFPPAIVWKQVSSTPNLNKPGFAMNARQRYKASCMLGLGEADFNLLDLDRRFVPVTVKYDIDQLRFMIEQSQFDLRVHVILHPSRRIKERLYMRWGARHRDSTVGPAKETFYDVAENATDTRRIKERVYFENNVQHRNSTVGPAQEEFYDVDENATGTRRIKNRMYKEKGELTRDSTVGPAKESFYDVDENAAGTRRIEERAYYENNVQHRDSSVGPAQEEFYDVEENATGARRIRKRVYYENGRKNRDSTVGPALEIFKDVDEDADANFHPTYRRAISRHSTLGRLYYENGNQVYPEEEGSPGPGFI